jgi:YidC/Oxa1 family membrane protein insertase
VKKQLHQTQAMKKLQPELVRIKKQAKGDKQLESRQMLELYKKHDVNPFRSIGILIVQLPIFIGLYSVIQIFTLHRDQISKFTYGFMENIGPVKHLIEHPDQFNEKLLGLVDLTKTAVSNGHVDIFLILLAVVAAGTQYVMSKQTMPQAENKKRLRDVMSEAADGKQADQSEMNAIVMGKMVKVLPFFMFFIMISVPGALALYYAVSNLVAVAQQSYLLKKDEEELEEIADEAPKTPGKKATAKARAKAATPATVTRIKAKDTSKKGKN